MTVRKAAEHAGVNKLEHLIEHDPQPQRTVLATHAGARQGYRVARSELGAAVPPHAVDSAPGAHRDEGCRLAASVKGIEAAERALRGELALTIPALGAVKSAG